MNNPNPNVEPNRPEQPKQPNEDQNFNPLPDTEINPAKPGNDTEVDLDNTKIPKYPGSHPPEEH